LNFPLRAGEKLWVIERFPERDDATTPAIIAERADQEPPPTFLLDEVDNLGLMDDPEFRRILNGGYGYKGRRSFMGAKRAQVHRRLFAPMALASIRNLPGPLMRRSVIIGMRRVPSPIKRTLIKFDPNDPAQQQMFKDVYAALRYWAYNAKIDAFPEMPDRLSTLPQEAWAPLVSVGDACSPRVSEIVRHAAVTIAGGAEEPRLLALEHVFEIFNTPLDGLIVADHRHDAINSAEQLTTETLVVNLRARDPIWDAWVGEEAKGNPHPITAGEFGRLMRDWQIHARTIWSRGSREDRVSAKGWRRQWFEPLWRDYEIDGTPSHPSKIIELARHTKRHAGDNTG
jgi:hypothetical protein